MNDERGSRGGREVSLNTRISLAIIVVTVPLFVWGGRLDARVQRLEEERAETRADLQEITRKLNDILQRMPLKRDIANVMPQG